MHIYVYICILCLSRGCLVVAAIIYIERSVSDSVLKRVFLFLLHLPDGSCQQRVKSIQPVMHLFVVGGLQQYPSMLSAHSKCVGSLEIFNKLRLLQFHCDNECLFFINKSVSESFIPSVEFVCPRCIPPLQRTG